MNKNIFKRGFTLIELLVVIAIIGILASVVLASLNSARTKGQNASAISSLNNARAQAEIYYNDNSNAYGPATTAVDAGVCSATSANNGIADLLAGAENALGNTSAVCVAGASEWAAQITLLDGDGFYCVDSTGAALTTATDPALSATNATCN